MTQCQLFMRQLGPVGAAIYLSYASQLRGRIIRVVLETRAPFA
jgi:hypothetical protein